MNETGVKPEEFWPQLLFIPTPVTWESLKILTNKMDKVWKGNSIEGYRKKTCQAVPVLVLTELPVLCSALFLSEFPVRGKHSTVRKLE